MDALDLKIVRTMGVVPFAVWPHSPEALKASYIAPRVGVSPDRVQDRIRALEEAHILTGYDVQPNPLAFGLRETTFHVRIPGGDKPEIVAGLWDTPGVFGLYDYIGEDLCIQMFFDSPEDREAKLRLVADKAGIAHLPAVYFDRPYPKPPRAITPLEVRILQAMRGKAKAPQEEIAAAVGVSVRTLRRRLQAMAEHGFYDVYVWFDFGAVQGRVPIELEVHFPRERAGAIVPKILEATQDDLVYSWHPPSAGLGAMECLVLSPSTAHTEGLRRTVAKIPGVTAVQVLIPAAARYSGTWVDELLVSSPRATARASPP